MSQQHRDRCLSRFALNVTVAALAWTVVASADARTGIGDLIDRLGEKNVPTGQDVVVGQVEAPTSQGSYRPNPNHTEFVGKSFTLMSGASGNSGHATTVGRNFYGLDTSIAPGITSIFAYEVNHWLQSGHLRFGSGAGTPPLVTPGGIKVMNHSWIGSAGNPVVENEVLRRADFLTTRDDVLLVVGVNNEDPAFPLMSHIYNGLSVGRTNGEHTSAPTMLGIDGPGRLKPEIVAPGSLTSWTTPVVGAAAALMVETARSDKSLVADPDAERADVIKAVLLAGADRGSDWTNNPFTSGPLRGTTTQPIDDVFGAGAVNVNRSHLIITGGRHEGDADPSAAPLVGHVGWDRAHVPIGASRYWRFSVGEDENEVSILITWNRQISPTNMNSWSVANYELHLWRFDDGTLVSLVGDEGLNYFDSGNVVSASAVDNIELLFVQNLATGEYAFELRRIDALTGDRPAAVAWLLPEPPACAPADLNCDGSVGLADLIILIDNWGPCPDPDNCPADLTGNGSVGLADLIILINSWG